MNDHRPRDPLSATLHTWQPEPPAPAPDFASTVWSRINSAEVGTTSPSDSPSEALAEEGASAKEGSQRYFLPLAASIALTFSVLAGSITALALNHARATDLQAAAYVRSIDPLQMTHNAAPAVPASSPAAHPHS